MELGEGYNWESLLARPRLQPDLSSLESGLAGRTVLITGAGGSIGSALAKAMDGYAPRRIVLLDAAEQSLYQIDRKLAGPHVPILGTVCDHRLVSDLFARYRPEIVFHAAAFKHVPLMEFNPFAAIQNNAVGTFILTKAAVRSGCERFVLVSTDKAADPGSIMGASKRIAELIVLAMQSFSTRMKAVRLGNVLGSQGSVVPLFVEQIARGESVTVTHPEASRYFMLLQEVVDLLILSLSDKFAGGILIPDLGEPVSIEQVARQLISSVGNSDHIRSQIAWTGLRPGDKLTERLLSVRESYIDETGAPLRAISSQGLSLCDVELAINELEQIAQERNPGKLLDHVIALVPSYEPSAVLQSALVQSNAGWDR